ncbi:MAG: IS30 family transposase [Actinoallomurus sp.]
MRACCEEGEVARPVGAWNLTNAERLEMRRRYAAGETHEAIAAAVGRPAWTVGAAIRAGGGLRPRRETRSPRRLSLPEREEISRGLQAGASYRAIARGLGRAPSTISREVRALKRGRRGYRAWRAELRRDRDVRRPRRSKLARDPRLRARVEALLARRWSPQQISATLRREHPHEPEMWVSHETIYRSLFVQGRGALRRELTRCLRTGRAVRRPRGQRRPGGQIRDMVMISERPAEVADRAVPGHWEGDLLVGYNNQSAIGTLVERRTRFVMLVALPDGQSAAHVRTRLAEQVLTLPAQLRRSLTWDQGREMAEHARFTVDTGVRVYFCDPHSPWQRGSNENTNGLLRQYFPRGTNLATHDQAHLDVVAAELNGRPRQTLGWMKPCEALAELLR